MCFPVVTVFTRTSKKTLYISSIPRVYCATLGDTKIRAKFAAYITSNAELNLSTHEM